VTTCNKQILQLQLFYYNNNY